MVDGTERNSRVLKLMRDTKAAVAIEYALIAALISVAAMAGYSAVGTKVQAYYETISSKLTDALG
jgi:pilus assembly protein Flp/PilA